MRVVSVLSCLLSPIFVIIVMIVVIFFGFISKLGKYICFRNSLVDSICACCMGVCVFFIASADHCASSFIWHLLYMRLICCSQAIRLDA